MNTRSTVPRLPFLLLVGAFALLFLLLWLWQ